MKDLRPIYYHEARERLVGNRLAVYDELMAAGPCTGSELAARMHWPVTSVRPRLTELRDCHWVSETGQRRNGEHEFAARTAAEVISLIAQRQADDEREARWAARDEQRQVDRIERDRLEQQQELFV